jgi:hypothetical protein
VVTTPSRPVNFFAMPSIRIRGSLIFSSAVIRGK